jgi:hypothetical protein
MQAQTPVIASPTPTPAAPVAERIASNPSAIYNGLKAQRSELGEQLQSLEYKRREITSQLRQGTNSEADRKGLEQRLTDIDQRIAAVDKQVAAANADVARAAAIPGAVVPPTPFVHRGPPEEVFVLSGMFMVIVLLPLSIAAARRLWRKAARVVATIPEELSERLTRIEQAVDAIAVEVERVGEGQRFVNQVFTEQQQLRALGAGAAAAVEIQAREMAPQVRR